MSVVRMKVSPWFKKFLYLSLTSSWVTGIAFFILNQWIRVEGEFGLEKHPWQFNILAIHGFAAFIMLMIIGAFIFNHTPIGWRTKRLRIIGSTLTTIIILQVISAYLLYYLSNEGIRAAVMYLHLSLGVSLPIFLLFHIVLGKRKNY